MKRARITPQQKLDVWKRQDGLCAECGRPVGISQGVEWDHRVPLGLTGTNDTDNWQALHAHCHRDKTDGDVTRIAKAKRQHRKHALTDEAQADRERRAAKKPKIQNRGFDTRYRRKLDGTTERRDER